MAPRWLLFTLVVPCFVVAVAACSGSSSESPWPVEPLNRETDPVGEGKTQGNVIDPTRLEDRYSPGSGGAGGARVEEDDELDTP